MAGGGEMTAQVTKEIADQGIVGITLTGHLPDDAIPLAYDAADIFLNTSASDNQPQTLIEASACGLPVVSSDAGGIPDLIADGVNGLLAPVGDTNALTDAILQLLDDPDLARNLSVAARQNARRFAWPQVAPQLAKAYAL